MARPEIQLDEHEIEDLASLGCPNEEIAAILGVSSDTLTRRFADAIKRGKLKDKVSFTRRVRQVALSDDKDRLGFCVLYAKIRGWYVERVDQKSEVRDVSHLDEDIIKQLAEAKECRAQIRS